jgi:hypothetical protein
MYQYPDLKPSHFVDSTETMVETCVRLAKREIEIEELLDKLSRQSPQEQGHSTEEDEEFC